MRQLVITQNQMYSVEGISYFKFTFGNVTYRDINCNLEKNDKYILEKICEYCELNYKKLKKNQLINLILNSNCIVLQNNNQNN